MVACLVTEAVRHAARAEQTEFVSLQSIRGALTHIAEGGVEGFEWKKSLRHRHGTLRDFLSMRPALFAFEEAAEVSRLNSVSEIRRFEFGDLNSKSPILRRSPCFRNTDPGEAGPPCVLHLTPWWWWCARSQAAAEAGTEVRVKVQEGVH